jgi:hypothetical protein
MGNVKRVRPNISQGFRSNSSKPADRSGVFGKPPLLDGEDAAAYEHLLDRITTAVKPQDIFEEVWIHDVADLQWEVLRLRRLKVNLVNSTACRKLAFELGRWIELEIHEDDGCGEHLDDTGTEGNEASEADEAAAAERRRELADERALELAKQWARHEPEACETVDRILALGNVPIEGVMVMAFFENLDDIERIEHLIALAENRRNAVLHELEWHRRTLGPALRAAIEDCEPEALVPKTVERIRLNDKRG